MVIFVLKRSLRAKLKYTFRSQFREREPDSMNIPEALSVLVRGLGPEDPKARELAKVLAELPEPLRGQLLDFLLDRAERARSVASKFLYAYVALSIARAGLKDLEELLARDRFRAWKRSLMMAGLAEYSIRVYVSLAKTMLRWLLEGRGQELPAWLRAERSSTL